MEIEQYEKPMLWKEVFKMEAALWPMEKKVNKLEKNVSEMEKSLNIVNNLRNELATTRLSSIQANKSLESLQAEIQQMKNEAIGKEKPSAELPPVIKNITAMEKPGAQLPPGAMETPKQNTAQVAAKGSQAGPDSQSSIVREIRHSKVSDTHDKVLIYVDATNNPKLQTLRGENPRIVLDFSNARLIGKENQEIKADGNFIKRIRIAAHRQPQRKVRVVFDMKTNRTYSLDRNFLEKECVYSFDIKAD